MTATSVAGVELRVNGEAFDITPLVQKFVWTESLLAGGFSWSLRVLAHQWDEWTALIMGSVNPEYAFRLVYLEGSQETSTAWRTAVVDKSRAAFDQDESMVFEIKGADKRLDLAQRARTRMWERRRASDVFRSIASEYGLTSDITVSANVDDWAQVRMDDWSFMRMLATAATVESNRGDSYLWMDEQTLRFGAPSFTDASVRRYDVAVNEARVNGYTVTYSGRQIDRDGGATLRGVGFDFAVKQGVVFDMDPAAAAAHPALASRVPRRMGDGLRVMPVFESDYAIIGERTRSRWGRAAPRYVAMNFVSKADLELRPNSVVAVENDLGDKQQTPFMGRYAVLEVQHVLVGSALRTSLSAYRRETQTGAEQPTGAAADNIGDRDPAQTDSQDRTVLSAVTLS